MADTAQPGPDTHSPAGAERPGRRLRRPSARTRASLRPCPPRFISVRWPYAKRNRPAAACPPAPGCSARPWRRCPSRYQIHIRIIGRRCPSRAEKLGRPRWRHCCGAGRAGGGPEPGTDDGADAGESDPSRRGARPSHVPRHRRPRGARRPRPPSIALCRARTAGRARPPVTARGRGCAAVSLV